MPVPIKKKIQFDSNGGVINVELKFETLLICTYTVDLREAESNASVAGFPKQGDNTNPQDDVYLLPVPVGVNNNRSLWINFVLIDQTGTGGSYKVGVNVIQDNKQIDTWTSEKKQIEDNFQIEIYVAQLVL